MNTLIWRYSMLNYQDPWGFETKTREELYSLLDVSTTHCCSMASTFSWIVVLAVGPARYGQCIDGRLQVELLCVDVPYSFVPIVPFTWSNASTSPGKPPVLFRPVSGCAWECPMSLLCFLLVYSERAGVGASAVYGSLRWLFDVLSLYRKSLLG